MRDEKVIDSVMSMGTSVDIMVDVYVVGSEMIGWVCARRQRIEITRRRNRGRKHKQQPVSVVEGREGTGCQTKLA